MQITFGDKILEVNLERSDLEDLAHSKASKLSSEIFNAIKLDVVTDIRAAIRTGDHNKSQNLEGYLTCLEDLLEMHERHIPEAIQSKE